MLVFLPEVDLSIAYGLAPDSEDKDNRRHFDWAEVHDWDVLVTYTDIRWRGSVVDRVTMWSIDEGRRVIPVGRRLDDSDVLQVEPWAMSVARAIAVVHGTHSDLDFYLQASRQGGCTDGSVRRSMARATFDAEESDSDVRRLYFSAPGQTYPEGAAQNSPVPARKWQDSELVPPNYDKLLRSDSGGGSVAGTGDDGGGGLLDRLLPENTWARNCPPAASTGVARKAMPATLLPKPKKMMAAARQARVTPSAIQRPTRAWSISASTSLSWRRLSSTVVASFQAIICACT
ncbi:hypothetical protein SAMN05660657_03317 [Geodermatophilus amargosae]|uniref:Uncharacterized protein n=1 Tax=Geodermatophilus amargosae TaxID=1296565 RepID=A0A1I7B615_9ACTN|nr:hypothetical protein [Geodermatophilus amargosae]SFT82575.1 hypothetical protein SAMN05660657_03317 [Geodermatophilus amargosae]